MKKFILSMSAALVTTFMLNGVTNAQMPEPPEVTEHHKRLHKEAGTWDAKIKMFVPGSDVVNESEGVEINEVVCGGLWVRSHFKGKMMGSDFEGIAFSGYDESQKKFVGHWADNLSTSVASMVGEFDKEANAVIYTVTMKDPISGEEMTQKQVVKHNDDGTRTFTMMMGEDMDTPVMEITYTKRKENSGSSSK